MEAPKAADRVSFRSKIDTWVVLVLLAAFAFTVVRAIDQIEVGASPGSVLLAFTPVFAYCAIIAAVGLPTRYDLTPTALVVRFACFAISSRTMRSSMSSLPVVR
jgi:hypothetical protein